MKLQKFCFSKKLPNLLKYGEVKFNFKSFLENLALHKSNISNRKVNVDTDLVVRLYNDFTKKNDDINLMRRHLNSMKEMASKLARAGKETTQATKDSKKYSDDIAKMQSDLSIIELNLMSLVCKIPNLTHPDAPIGDEKEAKVLKTVGEVKNNNECDHIEIGKKFDLFDFDNGTKITGSKFVILKNQAAILEQALINYAIDSIIKKGYTFIITPDIAKNSIIEGCGFNPRDQSSCIK